MDFYFAKNCWYTSLVCNCKGSFANFVDWLAFMLGRGTDAEKECVVMVVWQLWNNRNNVLWKGKIISSEYFMQLGTDFFLASWSAAQKDRLNDQFSP